MYKHLTDWQTDGLTDVTEMGVAEVMSESMGYVLEALNLWSPGRVSEKEDGRCRIISSNQQECSYSNRSIQ